MLPTLPCRSRSRRLAAVFLSALLPVLVTACGGGGGSSAPAADTTPQFTDIQPPQGPPGTPLVLAGLNLSTTVGVSFSPAVAASFNVESSTRITTTVPPDAQSGSITLHDQSGLTRSRPFAVTAPAKVPVPESFAPETARAYAQVNLAGSGFTGTSRITFGGVGAAWFSVVSDLEIRAAVPPGAASGKIDVTTPAGTASFAADFTFDPGTPAPPRIADITPRQGPVGTPVRITGKGLLSITKAEQSGIAIPFTLASDADLSLGIPQGAADGPVTLTSATGVAATSDSFTVTQTALPSPTILSFDPQSGPMGQRVEISGTRLKSVTSATVGGKVAATFAWDDGLLILWIPSSGAVSGPIVLTSPAGATTHPTPFTVEHPAPSIHGFAPDTGPAGTPVWVSGANLSTATEVLFGSTKATSIVSTSSSSIKVLVPAGAATGVVTVRTPGGEAQSTKAFTVKAGPSTQDVRISGMYVTQATQRLDGSVPLVAGRNGMLRVFLEANALNFSRPAVRVTVGDAAGAALLTRDIPAPRLGIPTTTDDTLQQNSWDLPLDGALIQPGNTLLAQILNGPGTVDLSPEDSVFPAGGKPMAMNAVQVPPLGLTIIPVNQGGKVGRVTDASRTLDSWTQTLRQIFPFKDIDVQLAEVLNWGETITPGNAMTWFRLREAIEAARLAANPRSRRYHFGVVTTPPGPGVVGIGSIPDVPGTNLKRSAVGFDLEGTPTGDNYYATYAHELGHNLGRYHSPCGGAAGPDKNYPYPLAQLGATGFDMAAGKVIHPALYADIMSYCLPQWISDYTFRSVLQTRAWELALPAASITSQPGLLVWGSIHDGIIELQPALQVADVSDPPQPGNWTLVLRDAAGAILRQISFNAEAEADVPEGEVIRSFAFAIPLTPDVQAALATLEVSDASGSAALGGSSAMALRATASPTGVALPRDPVATAWGPGIVHLSWDAGTHPLVLVKNAATGAVIGILKGGSADLVTDATDLDLNLSAGVRSVQVRVKVTP